MATLDEPDPPDVLSFEQEVGETAGLEGLQGRSDRAQQRKGVTTELPESIHHTWLQRYKLTAMVAKRRS